MDDVAFSASSLSVGVMKSSYRHHWCCTAPDERQWDLAAKEQRKRLSQRSLLLGRWLGKIRVLVGSKATKYLLAGARGMPDPSSYQTPEPGFTCYGTRITLCQLVFALICCARWFGSFWFWLIMVSFGFQ